MGTLIWLSRLTDILLKGLLSDGDPRMLLLQWGLSSLGFCSVSSDNFFVVRYTCLSLVLTIDFCYLQLIFFFVYKLFKKGTKIKKTMNYLEKNEFIKERCGGPTFKFWRGSWGPNFKLWACPGSHFWTLRGVPGPGVLVPFLHHANHQQENFCYSSLTQPDVPVLSVRQNSSISNLKLL